MNSDYWYPRFPVVYRAATAHLTAEQDGIYGRLIDYYMETRQPLRDNDVALARISGVSLECFQHSSGIIRAFFKPKNGLLFHSFCDNQLDIQDKLSKKRSKIAEKAARTRWDKVKENQDDKCFEHSSSNNEAMLQDATEQDKTGKKGDKPPSKARGVALIDTFPMPDGTFLSRAAFFDRLWAIYPAIRDKGSKKQAYEQFEAKLKKGVNHENIERGVERYRRYCDATGEKQPDFFRWIRDDGFERDWAITSAGTTDRGKAADDRLNNRIHETAKFIDDLLGPER